MELKNGLMEQNMRVNMKKEGNTVKVSLVFQMAAATKDNFFQMKYLGTESTFGLTEKHISASG